MRRGLFVAIAIILAALSVPGDGISWVSGRQAELERELAARDVVILEKSKEIGELRLILNNERTNWLNERHVLENEISRLKKENEALDRTNKGLVADIAKLRDENTNLTTLSDSLKARKEALKGEIAQLNKEKEGLVAANRDLLSKADTLTAERQGLSQTKQDLEREIANLNDKNLRLSAELKAVSQTKERLEAQVFSLQAERDGLTLSNSDLSSKVDRLTRTLNSAEVEREKALSNLSLVNEELARTRKERDGLSLKMGELLGTNKRLTSDLDTARARNESLEREATLLRKEKDELSLANVRLSGEVNVLTGDLATLGLERERLAQNLATKKEENERLLREHQDYIEKVATAVRIRDSQGAEVIGRIFFDSGSADIEPEGLAVLARVAQILKEQPGSAIFIEGHTDNIPVQTKQFSSNWELSAMRTLKVTRYLNERFGIAPERMKVINYGQYAPTYSNATSEGRAKNRRVEILLAPGGFSRSEVEPR